MLGTEANFIILVAYREHISATFAVLARLPVRVDALGFAFTGLLAYETCFVLQKVVLWPPVVRLRSSLLGKGNAASVLCRDWMSWLTTLLGCLVPNKVAEIHGRRAGYFAIFPTAVLAQVYCNTRAHVPVRK